MPTYLNTDTIPQGSHTFSLGLPFVFPGYVGTVYHDEGEPDTWEIRLVNPEGILTVKTTDWEFLDNSEPLIYVNMEAGELDKQGVYYYQVTKTTDGQEVKSEVGSFVVEQSVPSLSF